jgi:hypothetical protein
VSNLPRGKNADYWEGFNAEKQRRAALDSAEVAQRVARSLRRDAAVKQRIINRSSWFYAAMDQQELGEASGRELAARELKELGIEVGDNDPLALLDAHHSGRQWARDNGKKLQGSASDAADTPNFLSEYLGE